MKSFILALFLVAVSTSVKAQTTDEKIKSCLSGALSTEASAEMAEEMAAWKYQFSSYVIENSANCYYMLTGRKMIFANGEGFKDLVASGQSPTNSDVVLGEQLIVIFNVETAKKMIEMQSFDELKKYIFESNPTEEQKADLIKLILAAVKPIPSSKISENLAGYQALRYIDPRNPTFISNEKYYKEAVKNKSKYFRKLKSNKDSFSKVTFYHHPNKPRYRNSRSSIYLYIGKKKGFNPYLRMVTQYASDSWLFVEKVIVNVDEEVFTLTKADGYRFESDNNGRGIWEWQDEALDKSQLTLLNKVAKGKNVKIRFVGSQYRKDKTLTNGDKKAIGEVIKAFEEMKKYKLE